MLPLSPFRRPRSVVGNTGECQQLTYLCDSEPAMWIGPHHCLKNRITEGHLPHRRNRRRRRRRHHRRRRRRRRRRLGRPSLGCAS